MYYERISSDVSGFFFLKSSNDNVFCSFFASSSNCTLEDFISTCRGSILVSFVWVFFVVSRKRFLRNFAKKGSNVSSETLKNATIKNGANIISASIVACTLLPQLLTIVFHVSSHAQLPTAMITSCTRETDSGPIWKFIFNHHLSMFLGTNTFIVSICIKLLVLQV